MACMFTMMNQARLAVALQGVAIAERATQQALAYARERRQGHAVGAPDGPSPIIAHPDVKRMLLTMRALTQAARAICYTTALALDRAKRSTSEAERTAAHERASLLTPVAKAFATDIGIEVASLGVQVHGGMGYIEETGAAQHYRDARIAAIYEGTNGIQAIDLVTRKLPLSGGATVKAYIAELRHTVEAINVQQRRRLRLDQRPARGRARQPRAHHPVAAEPAAERSGHAARRRDALSPAVRARGRLRHAGRAGAGCKSEWRRHGCRRAHCARALLRREHRGLLERARTDRVRRRRQREPCGRRTCLKLEGRWTSAFRSTKKDHVAQRQDTLHHRRVARHRARDCAAGGARRRQHRDRRQDRDAASQAARHDLHRGRGDRPGRRPGAAARRRRARRGAGQVGDRAHRRDLRRPRHRGQQCQRGVAHAADRDRHPPLRPDVSDQHPRHVPGVQIRHSASRQGQPIRTS